MIRRMLCCASVLCLTVLPASAKQYVDYAPEKGLWEIVAVDVDPNHVDDYLAGLRKSEVPSFEVMKSHGIIDAYKFLVRSG